MKQEILHYINKHIYRKNIIEIYIIEMNVDFDFETLYKIERKSLK